MKQDNRNPIGLDHRGITWSISIDQRKMGETEFNTTFRAWPRDVPPSVSMRGLAWAYVDTNTETGVAKLIDIRVDERARNIGAGSLVLGFISNWCRSKNCGSIWGDLSEVDRERFDKLQYFYERAGYEFILFGPQSPAPEGTSDIFVGKVIKKLWQAPND